MAKFFIRYDYQEMNYESSENFDPEEYFKFDDIPTYVDVFTQRSTPGNLGNSEEVYNKQIKQLEALFELFTKKVQEMSVPTSNTRSDFTMYISNKVLFCSYYLFSKKIKLFRFKEYLYSKTISIIASILSLMKTNKEEKSEIIYCQIDELELFLNDKIKNNSYILKNQDKIKRLISFIHPKQKALKKEITEIPILQLKIALTESLKNMNELCDYPSYGSFDDFLYYFIFLSNPKKIKNRKINFFNETEKNFEIHSERLEEEEEEEKQQENECFDCMIDKLVNISIENFRETNSISFHSDNEDATFRVIEEKIFDLLCIEKPEEQIILKTSLIRIIFDRLYQHQEFIDLLSSTHDQENSIKFQKKCEIMCLKTPIEMQISSSLLIKDLMKKPFKLIIENDDLYLKKAVNFLNFLPLFTNPIDILAHIYLALKECEMFLNNQNIDSNDSVVYAKDEELNNISFDDIFPIFCATLSYCHPSNCLAIQHFLDIIKGFIFNSQLNYANSIFITAVSYINTNM